MKTTTMNISAAVVVGLPFVLLHITDKDPQPDTRA